jgi:hypothetical protein
MRCKLPPLENAGSDDASIKGVEELTNREAGAGGLARVQANYDGRQ